MWNKTMMGFWFVGVFFDKFLKQAEMWYIKTSP